MGFGMFMAGLIAQHISMPAIFWLSAGVCFAGLIFFRALVLKRYERDVII